MGDALPDNTYLVAQFQLQQQCIATRLADFWQFSLQARSRPFVTSLCRGDSTDLLYKCVSCFWENLDRFPASLPAASGLVKLTRKTHHNLLVNDQGDYYQDLFHLLRAVFAKRSTRNAQKWSKCGPIYDPQEGLWVMWHI